MRREIGEPDYVRDSAGIWGEYTVTHYFYFDRGYEVFFHDRRLRSVQPMSEERRADNRRMWRASQEVAPLVAVGASPRDVIAAIGEPGLVYVDTHQGYSNCGLFRPETLDRAFPDAVTHTYPQRNIGVRFKDASVAEVYPLGSYIQAQEQRTIDSLKRRQEEHERENRATTGASR